MACSAAEREPAASVKGLFELEPQDFGETLSGRVGVGARVDRVSTENLEAPRLSLRTTDSGAGDPFAFVVKTGVILTKGEVLSVTAEGTVTSGDPVFGTLGPDGSALYRGGWLSYMPSFPVFGLVGRIGASTFLIGTAQTILAPEAGELELVVNGLDRTKVEECATVDSPSFAERCADIECQAEAIRAACADAMRVNPTSGGFDVTVHRGLRAGITLASEPRIEDDTIVSESDHAVRAGAGWTKTGVVAKRGQKIFIDATGTLRAPSTPRNEDPSPPTTVDANGAPGWLAGARAVLPGRRPGRLFARVGSSIVEAGVSAVFLAPRGGEIELLVNDGLEPAYEGAFDVSLKVGVVPARGLYDADVATYRTASSTLSGGAARAWQPTSVSVRRGVPIVVRAEGRFTFPDDVFGVREAGPEGVQGILTPLSFPVPADTYGAVFGRVGDQVMYLGRESVVLSPADGVLELLVNLPRGAEGEIQVSVNSP